MPAFQADRSGGIAGLLGKYGRKVLTDVAKNARLAGLLFTAPERPEDIYLVSYEDAWAESPLSVTLHNEDTEFDVEPIWSRPSTIRQFDVERGVATGVGLFSTSGDFIGVIPPALLAKGVMENASIGFDEHDYLRKKASSLVALGML